MIELFYFWNDITYPVNIGIKTSHYITELVEGGFYENELRNKYHGVKWIGNGKTIILFENEVTIIAYPSLDMNYVVVVYNSNSKQYPAPNNCVVYNIDGTVHKIISTPVLKTPDENGNFIKGHHFDTVGWAKNKQNKTVLFLRVDEREWDWVPWYEDIEFNPETGEFGDLIWRATH